MTGEFYVSTDEEMFNFGPYATSEEAVAKAPEDYGIDHGEEFWVGQCVPAACFVSAETFIDALNAHACDEGPEDNNGYDVSRDAAVELQELLSAWAAKWDVRPTWSSIENVSKHVVPASTQEPAPATSP